MNTRLERAVSRLASKAPKGRVMDVQRPYLPMSEAMIYFGCKRDMLEGLRDNGKVRCSKVGRMLYFNVQDMERVWEENLTNAAAYAAAR